MEIVVKIGTDKSISLDVKAEDTIANVQIKIQADEGISPEKQRLIFAEHVELLPERTLNDYAITQGSALRLVRSDNRSAEMYRLLLRQAHQACKRQRLLLELQRLEAEGSDDD